MNLRNGKERSAWLCAAIMAMLAFPRPGLAGEQLFEILDGWSVAAKGYRFEGATDTTNLVADGRYATTGQTLAVSKRVSDVVTLGIDLGHATDDVDYDQLARRLRVEGKSVGAHATIGADPVWLDVLLSKGWNRYSGDFPSALHANWQGREWALDTQLRGKMTFATIDFMPSFGFHHQELDQDSYSTGGIFGVNTPSQSRTSDHLRFGLDLQRPFAFEAQRLTVILKAGATLVRNLDNHPAISPASAETGLAGGSFTFDLATTEPSRFPGYLSREERVGVEFWLDDAVGLAIGGKWHHNEADDWRGVIGNLIVRFR